MSRPEHFLKESEIQQSILYYLKTKGIFAWRNPTQAMIRTKNNINYFTPNSNRGAPDILGILKDGRTLCIEVKTPQGKLTPHQRHWLDRAKKQGALAFVARSLDDVIPKL